MKFSVYLNRRVFELYSIPCCSLYQHLRLTGKDTLAREVTFETGLYSFRKAVYSKRKINAPIVLVSYIYKRDFVLKNVLTVCIRTDRPEQTV